MKDLFKAIDILERIAREAMEEVLDDNQTDIISNYVLKRNGDVIFTLTNNNQHNAIRGEFFRNSNDEVVFKWAQ